MNAMRLIMAGKSDATDGRCRRWMLVIVKGNAMQFHLGQINRYFSTLGGNCTEAQAR